MPSRGNIAKQSQRILGGAILALVVFSLPTSADALCCKCYKGAQETANSYCLVGETSVTDCSRLVESAAPFTALRTSSPDLLADVSCDPTSLSDTACQEIGSGGSASAVCQKLAPLTEAGLRSAIQSLTGSPAPGTDAGDTASDAAARPFQSLTPELGVDIPGLELSPATKVGGSTNIPFLAEYINGVYRYLIGIVLIVAIVMMVYGGFRYLIGSAMDDVSKGKTIIRDALIGMILVISAYTILNTVNPATINLKTLELNSVEYIELIDGETYQAATGEEPPGRAEVREIVRQVASERGLDVCAFETVAAGESGFRSNVIGYDANVPRTQVGSRVRFILGGRKYNGQTFSVPSGAPLIRQDECPDVSVLVSQLSDAQTAMIRDGSIRNNDRFNPNAPPDYGLDTRFSVGFGVGGVTILTGNDCQMSRCPDGNVGVTVGGRCYTPNELLQPRPQLEAAASIYERNESGCARYRDPIAERRCMFARYIGRGCSARFGSCRRMKAYATCSGNNVASRERSECRDWLAENSDVCNDFNRD